MPRRLESTVAPGILIALAIAFFFPIFRGATFSTVAGRHVSVYPWRAFDPVYPDYPQNDQADLSYPWQILITKSVRAGQLPYWNPYSFGGQPFFANGSSAVLYPPKFLTAVLLTPSWAHDALSIFHVVVAGIAMWLFLGELSFGAVPALLGAIAWMLCPFNMAWLHLEVVAPAAAWLPMGCFLAHRGIERESWAASLCAAVALAAALIGGHLLFMALVYGVVVAYAGALTVPRLFARRSGHRRDDVLRLLIIVVAPLMFAAAVLVPTVLYLRSLGRAPLPYDLAHESIRVPYKVFAHLLRPAGASPVTELDMHEMSYVGRLVALLAVVGFFARHRGVWFARLLVAVTFLVATDTVVLKWIYAVFPQFSFFSPLGRLLNFFDFGVIILGTAGLETLLRLRHRGWIAKAVTASAAAVVVLTAGELVVYARKINPEFPPRQDQFSFPRTPLIRRLGEELATGHNGPGRLIPIRRTEREAYSPPILSANEATAFGFESVAGWDSTLPNRAETLWRILAGEPADKVLRTTYRRAYWASFDVAGTRLDLLPHVGVTTIVSTPEVSDEPLWEKKKAAAQVQLESFYSGVDGNIYRIAGVDGGPALVSAPTFANSDREALGMVLDRRADARGHAVLEIADVPLELRGHGSASAQGSARVVKKDISTEEIAVESTGDAWVVLPTTWERGWSAEIDGRPAPVVRADYAFQAVPVPAGKSRLRLSYRPPGLEAGIAISVLSAVIVIVAAVRSRNRLALSLAAAGLALGCGRTSSPPEDSSIHMILATYGYNCGAVPGNALDSVRKRCEGNLNCDYKVEMSVLGDPAPRCQKNFIVNYRCFDGARERRVVLDAEASGSVISLTCE